MIGTPSAMVTNDVLKELRDCILTAIRAGVAEKNRVYVPGASEIAKFYLGQHKYIFDPKFSPNQLSLYIKTDAVNAKTTRTPIFQMSDNVAANYLQIMSPYLLQGELERIVDPTKPFAPSPACYGVDPQQMQMLMYQQGNKPYLMQQQQAMMKMQMDSIALEKDYQLRDSRAGMMQAVLQYIAKELALREERKRVVEESLILGCGAYLTQVVQMPGSNQKLIGSNYVMMNDIVWDPDATRTKDCKWLAIQFRMPAWMVSRITGCPEGDLKGNASSTIADTYAQSLIITAGPENIHKMPPADEIVFWKVWSRMGTLARTVPLEQRSEDLNMLDQLLGDNTFFIVSEGCDYPLNMNPTVFDAMQQMAAQKPIQDAQRQRLQQIYPPQMLQQMAQQNPQIGQMLQPIDPMQPLKQATNWQIPFHLDIDDPWPITTVEHYLRNGSPYPIPPLEFALAYMKFMVWVISFVADKCYRAQRAIWLIDDSVNEQLRVAIEDSQDEAVVKMKDLDSKTVANFCQILEAPDVRKSIFDVYEFFKVKFQEITGMTDVMQAQMSRSMRSATEAQVVNQASQLRPQAMASNVMYADSRLARKEAIACQLLLDPNDVLPILGMPGAVAWQNIMKNIDVIQLMRETSYDVVASQGRVHDLSTRQDQSNKMAQLILPILVQVGQATGQFGPANAVLAEWAKANQIDPQLVHIPDMPPPMMNPDVKGQASQPKEQKGESGP